jgi:hypothetical protein
MIAALLSAALLSSAAAQDEPLPCSAYEEDPVSLNLAVAPARPGGELAISANTGLHGMIAVPLTCLADFEASDPAVVIDAPARRVRIAENARPGSEIRIRARIGAQALQARFRVAPVRGPVLTGFWSQETVDCGGPIPTQPLRELRFADDDRYAVTFVPFEVRQDYWGPVVFDPTAGRIIFAVEHGNMPLTELKLAGRATFEGEDKLVLEGLYFGGLETAPPAGCRYVFSRR